jgi:hypothetical protein
MLPSRESCQGSTGHPECMHPCKPFFSGYDYPVPEVTLPIRPVTTTPAPAPITTPSALYGAPPPGAPGGAPRRQGRRGKRQGRRVRVEKSE